jgi:ABC-type bacteriocin/lantibiotic exporter with double-glycine peptidase domain
MTLWGLLTTGLREVKRDFGLVLMTSLVIGILFLGLVLLVDGMIFRLLMGEKIVVQAAALLLVGVVAYILLETGRQIALYRLKIQLALAQQTALYNHLLTLPLSVYRAHDTARLAQTAYEISTMLAGRWLQLLCITAEILPLLAGLWLWLPVWMLISLIFTTIAMVAFFVMLYRSGWQQAQSSNTLYTLTRHLIQAVAKLRAAGTLNAILPHWTERQQQHERSVRRFASIQLLLSLILMASPVLLALIWAQANLAAGFAAWLFFSRLAAGLQIAADLSGEWAGYRDFLAKTRVGIADSGGVSLALTGDIVVEDVVFRYQPASDPILNGVSLRVRAGQRAAIVGISGAGKSTLLRLLAAIDRCERGSIRFDGHEISQLDGLHQQIGIVLQDSTISAGSIWSNINGFTQFPIEAAWAAARKAEIADVIDGLVMKMHTLVDEHASILSRGQAQRLLLARALVHQPRILLLDDATNAIDAETQTKIFRNLADHTLIITTQRLSTLQHMDVIFVLHAGRIAEQGSCQELIAHNGVFAQLMQRQLI